MARIKQKRSDKDIVKRGSAAHSTSAKNEKNLMIRLGGKLTPRSGAGTKKADGFIKGLARIEVKGTIHDSFRVTKDLLAKNDEAALSSGEIPILAVQFLSKTGKIEDEQAVIRMSDLEQLLHTIQELRTQCR